MPKIKFAQVGGEEQVIDAPLGKTVMEAATANAMEQGMLEGAVEPGPKSRLSCLRIPAGQA